MSRRALAPVLLVLALVAIVVLSHRGEPRRRGPVVAPSTVLPDLAGKSVKLDDLRGKVVVLNLWATWCPPCVEEMPTLDALSKKMASRDLVVLAVAEDEDSSKVKPWIEQRKFELPVLLDARGQVGAYFGITGYPETFIIDRQGKVVHRHVGFRDWVEPGIVAALERLMSTGEWKAPA